MKKVYIQPSMEEVKISTATVLAMSVKEGQASEWGAQEYYEFDENEEYEDELDW